MAKDIAPEITEFVTKWALATKQSPELASNRFWELMCSGNISEEEKLKTIDGWAAEAGLELKKGQ